MSDTAFWSLVDWLYGHLAQPPEVIRFSCSDGLKLAALKHLIVRSEASMARFRALVSFIAISLFLAVPVLQAQIRGVAPSVSSFGFGGNTTRTPGVAASVTSLGPHGFGGRPVFGGHSGFSQNCCFFNPGFRNGTHRRVFDGRRRHDNFFFRGGVPVLAYPYPYAYSPYFDEPDDYFTDDDYQGGPTIYDRRGSGLTRPREAVAQQQSQTTAATSEPVTAQPSTLLVFKDGHQSEIQNYAIVGGTLFDLTENRSHKILLADLDLPATRKANDDRGVDFNVPAEGTQ
jgi:hypothetical protein